jgi:signal transduction histidine kinase
MQFNKFLHRYIYILLLIFLCLTSFARSGTDTLLHKLKNAQAAKTYRSDTGSVKLLNQLSDQYLYKHADSALNFAKEGLKLAQVQKYNIGQALSLMNMSRVYYVMGDYFLSLDAASKLMDLSNKIGYKPGKAGAYQIIGLTYAVENKFGPAISNLKNALNLFIKLKDNSKTGKAYFNIGLCYDEMAQHQRSIACLNKAIAFANKSGDHNLVSMALNRTGEANFHLKKYEAALSFYQQVIDSKYSSNWEVGFALSGLAQAYYGLGQFDKAILNGQKSLSVAQRVNSQSDRSRALKILAESYAANNDFKQAYNYQLKFKNTSDSLFNKEKDKEVNNLHLKQQQADNTWLVNEIKIKEQSIAFSKRLLIFRNSIAVVVIVLLFFIIRSNRQKTVLNRVLQKQNTDIALQKTEISQQREILHELNHTKDKLFSVISHDLRSPFAAILQTMDSIHSGDISADEQKEIMNSFYQQLSVVTIMVNNLLVWANSQQSGIKTDPVTLNATKTIDEIITVSNYMAKSKRIILKHTYDGQKWIMADLDHVKIIFHNLVGNAIKFTPHGGTIKIYYTDEDEYVAIHVRDNGIGIFPQKMEKLFKVTGKDISGNGTNNEVGAGIGLGLIKQFVDANNGRLVVQSKPGEGAEFIVYLEKAPDNELGILPLHQEIAALSLI